jgi:exodeoxyribonuclease VII large subunit
MAARCVEVKRRRWDAAHDRLRVLGPERPLRQGYALIEHQGKNIRQAGDLAVGDEIRIRFHDGARIATVTNEGAG